MTPDMNPPDGHKEKGRGAMDRRSFLAALAGCGAAGLTGLQATCSPTGKEQGRLFPQKEPAAAAVARLKRPSLLSTAQGISPDRAAAALSDLLSGLGGGLDPSDFLKSLIRPGQRVGIKLNCLAGKGLSPRPVLVQALAQHLEEAGVDPDDIIVFERTERELRKAGFTINQGSGVKVLGNDSRGAGYDSAPVCHESIGSCFSTILTRRIDVLVNFGVLKDHDLAGVSVGLKNLYGLIHNPNKYHDNHCSPFVAHVAAAPPVRDKLRLTLCDGLTAQYQGGPALKKNCTWEAGILLASLDPVAIDAVGAAIIDEKRQALGLKTLAKAGRPVLFLEEARKIGLGEDRLERIKEIRID